MMDRSIVIDATAFSENLWPKLARFVPGNRQVPPSFGGHEFIVHAGKEFGITRADHARAPIHVLVYEFLWDAVRVGILVPTNMSPMGALPFQNYSFCFTAFGETWRKTVGNGAGAFSDSLAGELRAVAPDLGDEAVTFVRDAQRAHRAGLGRAAMFLLGLMSETLLADLFEAGSVSSKVVQKASKKQPGKAFALQDDVKTALEALEPKPLSKGFANEWAALVGTMRDYRNKCAHDAAFEPSNSEVHTALFMLPRLFELSQLGLSALK